MFGSKYSCRLDPYVAAKWAESKERPTPPAPQKMNSVSTLSPRFARASAAQQARKAGASDQN
eukprot:8373744-Pyramimonas_sp.AAC.1